MTQKDEESEPMEWIASDRYAARNKLKAYAKKHPKELAGCIKNLKLLIAMLNDNGTIGTVKAGFFRNEFDGIYRIGQTGVASAKETRLYVHPKGTVLHVLTVGDKDTQQDDLRLCAKITKQIDGDKR